MAENDRTFIRECPGCSTEFDVSKQQYIHVSYHPKDVGGFCCSSECAHKVINEHSLKAN